LLFVYAYAREEREISDGGLLLIASVVKDNGDKIYSYTVLHVRISVDKFCFRGFPFWIGQYYGYWVELFKRIVSKNFIVIFENLFSFLYLSTINSVAIHYL